MIIDFSVENFRSIKNEQLLSMFVEQKPKIHAGNISYIDESLGILKTCAIYGSNAAGKTNLILAFEALRRMIVDSGDWKDGDLIDCYEPYLLSDTSRQAPTKFEIEFYIDTIRYVYCVEFNRNDVIFEKLDYYPSSRVANLFTRNSPTDWKSVKFGEHYKGGKKQIAFFSNNTYLAKAGNTPDSPEIIRKIFNFFRRNTMTMLTNYSIGVFDWDKDERTVNIINTFLRRVDLGIQKFEFEKVKDFEYLEKFPKDLADDIKKKLVKEFSKKAYFYHETDTGNSIRFESDKESSGTNRMFKLLPFFIEILRNGFILFIDEIENSFHPHIAELIIKLFNDPLVNKNNAQLIFTTHNLALMSQHNMRKDQIYLTEKSVEDGTQFYCLESYESALKNSSPFAKWYNEGRLGAIPTINYRDISDAIKEVF